jgi:hypothetical protein
MLRDKFDLKIKTYTTEYRVFIWTGLVANRTVECGKQKIQTS